MKKFIFIFFIFSNFLSLSQDATSILKKSEEKIRGIKSSYVEMAISIVRPKWRKEMTMKIIIIILIIILTSPLIFI